MSLAPVIAVLIPLLLLVPFALLLYFIVFFSRRYRQQRNSPLRTVPAQVNRKWARTYDIDLPFFLFLPFRPLLIYLFPATETLFQQAIYWAEFSLGDAMLELAIPEKVYLELADGDLGKLSHQGEKFIAFSPLPAEEWAALATGKSVTRAHPVSPPDKSKWDKMPRIS